MMMPDGCVGNYCYGYLSMVVEIKSKKLLVILFSYYILRLAQLLRISLLFYRMQLSISSPIVNYM